CREVCAMVCECYQKPSRRGKRMAYSRIKYAIQLFNNVIGGFLMYDIAAFDRAGREMKKELAVLFKKKQEGTFKRDPNAPLTIYYELLEQYDDPDALLQDATLMYSAGVDTATWLLTVAFYHLAKNK